MNLYIPVFIVVFSNTLYHICAKSTPDGINTYASLTVTYAVGALFSLVLFFATQKHPDLLAEFRKLNWTSFVLGLAIVGLEAGFLLMYKMGWSVSTGQLVASAFVAVALVFAGFLLYKEELTATKLAGVGICLAGLYLLNR